MNLEQQLNYYGKKEEPFFFIINYDKTQFEVIPLKDLPKDIVYKMDAQKEFQQHTHILEKEHISFEVYKQKFLQLAKEIQEGNTYLANLTTPTKIDSKLSLEEIYTIANAKFKLKYKDKFVCFSPERFCSIENNIISTYPMKGTIDASIPNAQEIVLNDPKELAEHTMIVDLLRNDLSIQAKKVRVEQFRYCEKIYAGKKELLQVSSKISGQLAENWKSTLGTLLCSLLPAGSITGTPKKKTVEILNSIEAYNRDYFTGIFGVFDGKKLDSSVIIRYIEQDIAQNLIYKSGGGITSDSDLNKEYQEMCDKVYIP